LCRSSEKTTPRFTNSPKYAKKITSVSGVLRKMLTHPAPNQRSTGMGETRMAARSSPSASESTAEAAVSPRISRNPLK
jgi:hypothetical protein